MTPAVMANAGVAPNGDAQAAPNELLQRAFQQGVEYAQQQQAQLQNDANASASTRRLDDLEQANAEQARLLRERTEALQKREYRSASQPSDSYHQPSLLPSWRRRLTVHDLSSITHSVL